MQGMVSEEVMDARHFQSAFPDQPLVGFYAGGEIGPQAVAFQERGVACLYQR